MATMSEQERRALLQETLDLSHQHRERMAIRHGMGGPPPRNVIGDQATHTTIREQAMPQPTAQTTAQPTTQPPTNMPLWKKAAIAATALGAGAGGALGAQQLVGNWLDRPAAIVEVDQASEPPSGELLPWLRGQGYNLPPASE